MMSLQSDTRLKSVEYSDLLKLSPSQQFIELTISLPWLIASLCFAYFGYYIAALPCSFIFFLTGLRLVHNAYHYSLGISKTATDLVLLSHSLIMITSMHAVKYNHLQHHKHCMTENDIEGKSASMSALKALAFGPFFPILLHKNALQHSNRTNKKWILMELAGIILLYSLVFILDMRFLQYHFCAMIIGECLTAFFAVWSVHHDCDDYIFARTQRGRWANFLSYNMFYHLEHHLFPKVPTINLPKLAERIEKKIPDLQPKQVIPLQVVGKETSSAYSQYVSG